MKGDFSRRTFDPNQHFSRVLMQQGRVLLDADWNEQTSILLHYIRTLVADLHGSRIAIDNAFKIDWIVNDNRNRVNNDFGIDAGHLYVDGILCENEQATTYATQDDLPIEPPSSFQGTVLVYVDVWERHVTHVQDPAIREVALGGPDTTTRARVVWQVKVHQLDGRPSCEDVVSDWSDLVELWQPRNRGQIKAWASKSRKDPDDACVTPPDARYRGVENRLYRVEVHTGGSAESATFKWSRENGSVVLPVRSLSGQIAQVETLGPDKPHSVQVGDWVEILDDEMELLGRPGVLAEVETIDPVDRKVELTPAEDALPDFPENAKTHPILRRWDHRHGVEQGGSEAADGALKVEEDAPVRLEDGIEVQFESLKSDDDHGYRTRDYWLIPARTTGDIEWASKNGDPVPLEPFGVQHHYAPLAVLTAGSAGDPEDCLAPHRVSR